MDDLDVEKFAMANLPANRCALTGRTPADPVIMHRDLSDKLPPSLHDLWDNRLVNIMIVDRDAREHYYDNLKTKGIVLALSGGLDSITVLHWCLKMFGSVNCLMFDYGQRHKHEIDVAESYVKRLQNGDDRVKCRLKYNIVDMSPINTLAESSLTRENSEVPKGRDIDEMSESIPSTFVPGRNVYFTTALAQVAYTEGWRHIALGANVLDYSGYPDCRPEFFHAMRSALRIGVFNGDDIGIHAPLMMMTKVQIIKLGLHLGVDYSLTHSCYMGTPGGCGECDSCQLRRLAFAELGMVDPSIAGQNI